MPQVLQSRPNSNRSYFAIAVFVVVYLGVLLVVFAPRDMISVQSGSVIRDAD
jgi:asparagine N-glycosylation enzyme membrane subunit Stt3